MPPKNKLSLPDLKDIRLLRERYNIPQIELARRSEVSQSTLSRIEGGTLNPTWETVRRIFEKLTQLIDEAKQKKTKLPETKVDSPVQSPEVAPGA